MAGYQNFQDYRHPNDDFTEDEDEADEKDLTEDESTEEDYAPYQVRHYHHYYFAPVTYIDHHHHHYYYNQITSTAYARPLQQTKVLPKLHRPYSPLELLLPPSTHPSAGCFLLA